MQAFRRRILDVSHVEIKPAAIEQKSAIARRFLVITVMQIDRSRGRPAEEIILNLRRPKLRVSVRLIVAQQTAVLCFDANDTIHYRELTHRIRNSLSAKWRFPFTLTLGKGAEHSARHLTGSLLYNQKRPKLFHRYRSIELTAHLCPANRKSRRLRTAAGTRRTALSR